MPAHITGPKTVDLGHMITVDLPPGIVLFEADVAKKMVEATGNSGDNVLAIIVDPKSTWGISVDYDDVGYVTDDDADKLDAGDLLDQYKEGVKQQNEKRKQMGLPDMVLDGWSEMPRYERASHHLLWGLKGHNADDVFINYFTRVLGRNGFMSIDLVDKPDNIEKAKVAAQPVMNAITFTTGARYENHASGDKSSGLGLKALILGGAGIAVVSKAGFFIKLLLIFKKAIIFVVAGIAGFFRWLFGRKKKVDVAGGPSMTPPPGDGPPPGGPPTPPSGNG